jgi:hypothetical protein
MDMAPTKILSFHQGSLAALMHTFHHRQNENFLLAVRYYCHKKQ